MIRVWSTGASARSWSSSAIRSRTAAMSIGVRVGRRQVGGVVVEPVAGGEAAVLVFGPSPGEVRVGGLGSVAGGGGVEVAGVAPGGELADLVVPDLGAGGVGGSWPVPVGEPAGGVGGEGEGESLAAHGDRRGQEVGLVGVDAVGVEGGGPVGGVFVEGGLGEVEVGVGFGGGVGGFGVVDGSDVGPFEDLAGASRAVGGGELDDGGAGVVDDGDDGADVVPVGGVDPCAGGEELAVGAGPGEAQRGVGGVGVAVGDELGGGVADVDVAVPQPVEVVLVGDAGDGRQERVVEAGEGLGA